MYAERQESLAAADEVHRDAFPDGFDEFDDEHWRDFTVRRRWAWKHGKVAPRP
jgi:hypothetical protein